MNEFVDVPERTCGSTTQRARKVETRDARAITSCLHRWLRTLKQCLFCFSIASFEPRAKAKHMIVFLEYPFVRRHNTGQRQGPLCNKEENRATLTLSSVWCVRVGPNCRKPTNPMSGSPTKAGPSWSMSEGPGAMMVKLPSRTRGTAEKKRIESDFRQLPFEATGATGGERERGGGLGVGRGKRKERWPRRDDGRWIEKGRFRLASR